MSLWMGFSHFKQFWDSGIPIPDFPALPLRGGGAGDELGSLAVMGAGSLHSSRDGGRIQLSFPAGTAGFPLAEIHPRGEVPAALPQPSLFPSRSSRIAWAPFPERFVGADGSEQEAGAHPWRRGEEAELGEHSRHQGLLCAATAAPAPSLTFPCSRSCQQSPRTEPGTISC